MSRRASGSVCSRNKSQGDVGNVIVELLEGYDGHPHNIDEIDMEHFYSGKDLFDGIHVKWLDKGVSIDARNLEMFF